MHQQGNIVRWDAGRGFGFVRSARTQADVFFHVRDFHGAPEPALHMAVEYEEIHAGGKGTRAKAVRPLGDGLPPAPAAGTGTPPRSRRPRNGRRPGTAFGVLPGGDHPGSHGHGHGHGNGSNANRGNGGGGENDAHGVKRSTQSASPARPASSTGQRAAPRHRSAHGVRSARGVSASAPPPATGSVLLLLLACWLALLGTGLGSGLLPLWTAGALLALNLLTLWTYAADKNAARSGAQRVSENRLHLMALLGGWPAAWLAQHKLRHKTRKASFRTVYWLTAVLHCAALALWLWLSLWNHHATLFF